MHPTLPSHVVRQVLVRERELATLDLGLPVEQHDRLAVQGYRI
jgi:hypothetical protein